VLKFVIGYFITIEFENIDNKKRTFVFEEKYIQAGSYFISGRLCLGKHTIN
jgi:hypothetical protein